MVASIDSMIVAGEKNYQQTCHKKVIYMKIQTACDMWDHVKKIKRSYFRLQQQLFQRFPSLSLHRLSSVFFSSTSSASPCRSRLVVCDNDFFFSFYFCHAKQNELDDGAMMLKQWILWLSRLYETATFMNSEMLIQKLYSLTIQQKN